MNITFRNDKLDVPDVSEAEAKTICHLLSEGFGDEALAVFEEAAKRAMNPKMVAELQRVRKKYGQQITQTWPVGFLEYRQRATNRELAFLFMTEGHQNRANQ